MCSLWTQQPLSASFFSPDGVQNLLSWILTTHSNHASLGRPSRSRISYAQWASNLNAHARCTMLEMTRLWLSLLFSYSSNLTRRLMSYGHAARYTVCGGAWWEFQWAWQRARETYPPHLPRRSSIPPAWQERRRWCPDPVRAQRSRANGVCAKLAMRRLLHGMGLERDWERERERGVVCRGVDSTGVGGARASLSHNRGRTCRVQWSSCCCERSREKRKITVLSSRIDFCFDRTLLTPELDCICSGSVSQ